ncbi:hypothetical protein HMPREF9430_00873, partial [Solobacterium moorei F0204]
SKTLKLRQKEEQHPCTLLDMLSSPTDLPHPRKEVRSKLYIIRADYYIERIQAIEGKRARIHTGI